MMYAYNSPHWTDPLPAMAKVLIVDGDTDARKFTRRAIELAGHRVYEAYDGEEAARRLRTEGFDVLFSNVEMQPMDGLELLKVAREEQPEVQVVLMTNKGSVGMAVKAMKAGAFDIVEKPFKDIEEIQLMVARADERKRLKAVEEREELDASLEIPIVYEDPVMEPVHDALKKVAVTNATVLLTGESGTGKEVAARAIHGISPRSKGPFVAINCAAISESLLESELFGHEKGAFTGASQRRRGRLELAAGGTFFLDEVGELKPALQAKLLRVLETRLFERVGGHLTIEADVRWVAATNRNLKQMVEKGEFREDLYHRLAVFPVGLPPLRRRRKDIVPIANHLLRKLANELGRSELRLAEDAKVRLTERRWPGNIRQLRNELERAAILAGEEELRAAHFVLAAKTASRSDPTPAKISLADMERAAIEAALAATDGNRRQAAARLGIGERTLYDKIKKYDL